MIGSLNSQVQLLDRFISNRSFQVSCCVDVSCTAIFPLNVRLYEIFMRFHEILRSFMRSHGIVLACCPYFTNNWMLSVISRDFERFHEVYKLNMHMSSFQHTLQNASEKLLFVTIPFIQWSISFYKLYHFLDVRIFCSNANHEYLGTIVWFVFRT